MLHLFYLEKIVTVRSWVERHHDVDCKVLVQVIHIMDVTFLLLEKDRISEKVEYVVGIYRIVVVLFQLETYCAWNYKIRVDQKLCQSYCYRKLGK